MPASDDLAILRRLLAGWRASRDPALEPLIDKAGAQIARARGPIGGSKTELEVRWHELAKGRDIGDLDRLLGASWKIGRTQVLARIAALATLPPDPRIARGLADLGRTFISEDMHDVHRAIAKLIARTPSVLLLPALDAIEAARVGVTRLIYADARHAISQLVTEAAEPSLLDRARAELGADDDLSELLAQHVSNPGDLGLRAVLADRLQAAGEPRGEFIALQLDGSAAALRRADRLLALHVDDWTGPLPGLDPEHRRFARGFLVGAYVDLHAAQLGRALDRPEWATLEELGVGGRIADVASLVARMPLLRRFAGPRWAVEQLAAAGGGRGLQAMVVSDGYLPPRTDAFPVLDVLLWSETWRPPTKLPKLAAELGLRAVGFLSVSPDELVRMIKAARALPLELRFSWGDHPRGLSIPSWQIRIGADRTAAELQHDGRRHILDLVAILDTLADAGISRFVIADPTPGIRGAAGAFTRAAVEYRDDRFDLLASPPR